MERTTVLERIDQNQFSVALEMLKTLLDKGAITRQEADRTARRIASENDLSLIYLW